MEATRKVKALFYPMKQGNSPVSAVDREIKTELKSELERLKIDADDLRVRSFCGGKVVMYYNETCGKPTIRINDKVYNGPVLFAGADGMGLPADLTASQKRAIKAVVKRL